MPIESAWSQPSKSRPLSSTEVVILSNASIEIDIVNYNYLLVEPCLLILWTLHSADSDNWRTEAVLLVLIPYISFVRSMAPVLTALN